MDGVKWYHVPLIVIALVVQAPKQFFGGIWKRVNGQMCSVPGCGMEKVRNGMCEGHATGAEDPS